MDRLVGNRRNPVGSPVDTGRLSRRGKAMAITFIAFGLGTFFLPIIKLDPPVHGQLYWSVLDIALQLQATLQLETPIALPLFVPVGLV